MRTWLVPLGLMLSTSVLANGFYAGGQLGTASTTLEETSSSHSQDLGNSGVTYGLFGGYRMNHDQGFLAIEADYNMGDIKASQKVGAAKREGIRQDSYGLYLLVGSALTDKSDIYGRIGAVKGSFEAKESDGTTSVKYDADETGLALGLGTSYAFDEQLSLRLDYRYIKYKEFTFVKDGWEYNATDQHFTVGLQFAF